MSIVPGWHATIFAYFVAAIFSDVAMVITLVVGAECWSRAYLTTKHFDAIAALLFAANRSLRVSVGVFLGLVFGGSEHHAFWNRLFEHALLVGDLDHAGMQWFPSRLCFGLKVHSARSRWYDVSICFINIGMWFERYVIVNDPRCILVQTLCAGIYRPSVTEMIMVGSFFWFGFWFCSSPGYCRRSLSGSSRGYCLHRA